MSDSEEKSEPVIDFGRNPFEFDIGDHFSTMKLIGDVDQELAREFDKRIRPQAEVTTQHLLIDLRECGTLHRSMARSLMQIAAAIKKTKKIIRVVSQSLEHHEFFKEQGVSAQFPIVSNLELAEKDFAAARPKPSKVDVNFINAFLAGTVEVLKLQANTEATSAPPQVREKDSPIEGDISGVIEISSNHFNGSVIISFPEQTFLTLIDRMIGERHDAISPVNSDGAAELANIIFGYAKRILNDKEDRGLKMASPTVVYGKELTSFRDEGGKRIAVPFESNAGNFTVEIRVRVTV